MSARGAAAALALIGAVSLGEAAPAQQNQTIPEWLVLAIKYVSDDLVRPSTGIVVSRGGLVLLPTDFVAGEGEIYVLDGGTDPSRHGRQITLIRQQNVEGLALVEVGGLSRTPIVLAERRPPDDSVVQLLAFSDAASMQQGQWMTRTLTKVRFDRKNDTLVLARGNALPNVTGVVTDGCENVLGVSLARATPSAARTGATTYLWLGRLNAVLRQLQLSLRTQTCSVEIPLSPAPVMASTPPIQPAAPPPAAAEPPRKPAAPKPPPPPPPPPPELVGAAQEALQSLGLYKGPIDSRLSGETTRAIAAFRQAMKLPSEPGLDPATVQLMRQQVELAESELASADLEGRAKAFEKQVADLESKLAEQPATPVQRLMALDLWIWIVAAIVLLALIAVIVGLAIRARRQRALAELVPEFTQPFLVVGALSDGTLLRAAVAAEDGRVSAVIGRANADVLVRDPSVGRQHARLQGSVDDGLVLIDLGSINGTAVNGERCDRGRPVSIRPGDELTVGAVQLRLKSQGQ
jgi:hypothetical protein